MSQFTDSLTEVNAAIALLPSDAESFTGMSDEELTEVPVGLAAARHQLEAREARVAGEIARRSSYELGYAGLAQKGGFRTAEKLVQHLTGSTSREAAKLVRTGGIIYEAELITEAERTGEASPELTKPWLAPVGRAVAAGTISIEAAEAIRLGLGTPTEDITAELLAGAAAQLVDLASPGNVDLSDPDQADPDPADPSAPDPLNADQLLDRARSLRDELDEAGIADRERARHNARSFKRYLRPDGMTVYTMLADPENAAYLDSIYDALTSPRRGGPRMVDPTEKARDEAIEADPRSIEQLSFDGIMAVLRIGADTTAKTATRSVLGARSPAVRVLVTGSTLDSADTSVDTDGTTDSTGTGGSGRRGHGRIEGQAAPVSIETVERHLCESGMVPVTFDRNGQCIDLGREQRLYSALQRIGLAARDGGCRWPGCDQPASRTEAHHINHWKRDHGKTDLADGILLCRHHHMLLHNNHWEITRTGGTYWLHPPAAVDPTRTPRLMPHKSAALADLQREQQERDRRRRGRGRTPLTG
ncbi:HNH endonuclease signature motif containing protein [Homoserinimonas sp. A447]